MKPLKMWILNTIAVLVLASCGTDVPSITIVGAGNHGEPVKYGLEKLTEQLQIENIPYERVGSLDEAGGDIVILPGLAGEKSAAVELLMSEGLEVPDVPEALTIWNMEWNQRPIWGVVGSDERGLMYGLLDMAERIRLNPDKTNPFSEVSEITEQPDAPERAVSIYTMNRAYWESRFYDQDYWTRYLDILAKNRFNSLVVIFGYENGGFLAPAYPYFFDIEGFPDVHMGGITTEEQQRNLEALNRLIDMAHERGINFTVGIWDHIYRGGVQGGGIPGADDAPGQPQEHLVWGVNADNLVSYTKAGLSKFIKQVPDLDGIQLRIHWESGLTEEEQLTFFPEIFRMVKEAAPDMRLDLRAKELPDEVIADALEIGVNFRITTKHWMEQMGMPYHPTNTNPERSHRRHGYEDLLVYPKQYDIHWRLWNGGTARILLWGSPEYVRRFVGSTHLYDGDGFEVNEPLSTKMEAQPHDEEPFELLSTPYRYYDYEFERYWHFFQLFGRLGYNRETLDELWKREFELRFGEELAPLVEEALHEASWILPRIITSVFPYREFPMTRGWAEKERLGNLPCYSRNVFSDMPQFASFDDEARLLIEGGDEARMLPSENSRWLKETSDEINRLVARIEDIAGNNRSNELISTITDLRILSNLALFHSRRIPAAVSYRIFERTGEVAALEDAIAYERSAIEAWHQMTEATGDVYADNLKMGVCNAGLCGHWRDELDALEEGLASLEQKREELGGGAAAITVPGYEPASGMRDDERFKISHQPVINVPAGEPMTVSVEVTFPAGIKWVHLRHRSVNQEFEYDTLEMLPVGSGNTYRATVPANAIDPSWDYMYYIEVMDHEGNGTIYPDLDKETPYRFVKINR